jgi:hypothetical protein
MKLSDIKENKQNPRVIKNNKFYKLVNSLKSFPKMMELRPIVIDENNVALGGNMRLKALKELNYESIPNNWVIKIDSLSEEEKKEFIIKDNIGYGEWEWNLLKSDFNLEQLDEWGLDLELNNIIDNSIEEQTIHVDKSLQVLPKKEYIIIMADEDSEEWEELKSIFSCKLVRQGGCKIDSSSDKATKGLERVFDLETFKKRVLNELRSSNTK